MSGICGLRVGAGDSLAPPAMASELATMTAALQRRGPERAGTWCGEHCALGHTLLATTPEMATEQLPLVDAESGCAVTADARLDNRGELIERLQLQGTQPGDAELILRAYHAWGDNCPRYLLGDFAFAIHDGRRRRLFCARDHFGIRPFYYFAGPRLFAFASEPEALTALEAIPGVLNEGRIADFLVTELEGIDLTSTFYRDIHRLPPAHSLAVDSSGATLREYWSLEPGPELRLATDEAYAEAFLEVFTQAVACRLRSYRPVGVMMSGGVDSTAVAAVAAQLLSAQGRGPLPAFSAVSSRGGDCPETVAIRLAQAIPGLRPFDASETDAAALWPRVLQELRTEGEPFDAWMTLVRCMYLQAHDNGVYVMLDGVPGDNALSEDGYLPRLLRAGHWRTAWREAKLQNRFWKGAYPHWPELLGGARSAFTPEWARSAWRRLPYGPLTRRTTSAALAASAIDRGFAHEVDLPGRLRRLRDTPRVAVTEPLPASAAIAMRHPYVTVGLERYGRVAAALGIEPRHPWMDRRLVEFCINLPGGQRLAEGWPKAVLRRAMAGYLPDEVRYRTGKEHLGGTFTREFCVAASPALQGEILARREMLDRYIATRTLDHALGQHGDPPTNSPGHFFEIASLALWFTAHCRD